MLWDVPVLASASGQGRLIPVSYTHLDVYKRQRTPHAICLFGECVTYTIFVPTFLVSGSKAFYIYKL